MKTISTVSGIRRSVKNHKLSPVGFVPTMGALHAGHISLVRNAVSRCPLVVVSIYVNPTQFNDKNDLKNYPRTIENDLKMLGKVLRGKDIVFTPSDKEIYPDEDRRVFNFGNLERVMEALHRPGHFNGVGQVVSRLFDIVRPDIAFFGQKDFQQLAVIRELVRQEGYSIEIVGNPIIRENDGLAMSSRNMLLEPGIRKNAGIIFSAISEATLLIREHDVPYLKSFVRDAIEQFRDFKVEYFEIADDKDLNPVLKKSDMRNDRRYYGCIAVRAGKIRLIDNVEIILQ